MYLNDGERILLDRLEEFFDLFADLEVGILFSVVAAFNVDCLLAFVVIYVGPFHGLFLVI